MDGVSWTIKDGLYVASMIIGFGVMIFRQGRLYGAMVASQEAQDKEIKALKKIVTPDDSKNRPMTQELCDRQQLTCGVQRSAETAVLREDIKELKDLMKSFGLEMRAFSDKVARLDERTHGR